MSMQRLAAIALATLLAVHLPGWVSAEEEESQPIPIATVAREEPVDFDQDILPILRKNCMACHNATDAASDLVLESAQAILEGGADGPAVIAGDAMKSLLLQVSAHLSEPVMPPEGNDAGAKDLTPEELGLLKLWIDQGAKAGQSSAAHRINWQPLPASVNPILAAAVTPDGSYAFCGRGNRIYVYDVPGGSLLAELVDPATSVRDDRQPTAHFDIVQALAMHPSGQLIASAGYQTVKLWRKQVPHILQEIELGTGVTRLATSTDGERVFVGMADGHIRVISGISGEPIADWPTHAKSVTALSLHDDQGRLLTASADGIIRIVRTADGSNAQQRDTGSSVIHADWLYDDQQVVTVSSDHVVRVWQVTDAGVGEQPIRELKAHDDEVTVVLANPAAGAQLLTASRDGSVKLWDANSGNQMRVFAHGSPVVSASVSPDGSRLLSSGEDRSIKLWNVADGKLIAEVRGDRQLLAQLQSVDLAIQLAQQEANSGKGRVAELEKQATALAEAVTKSQEGITAADKVVQEKAEAFQAARTAQQAGEAGKSVAEQAATQIDALVKAAEERQTQNKAANQQLAELFANAKAPAADKEALKELTAAFDVASQAIDATQTPVDELVVKVQTLREAAKRQVEQTGKQLEELNKKLSEADNQHKDAIKKQDEAKINLQQAERDVARNQEAVQAVQAEIAALESQAMALQAEKEMLEKEQPEREAVARSLAFSRDGARFYAGDERQRIGVYDAASGNLLEWCTGLRGTASAVKSVQGGTLWSAQAEGTLTKWQALPQWNLERTITSTSQDGEVSESVVVAPGLSDRVLALAFSPDGNLLAAGSGQPSRNGPISFYATDSGQLVRTISEAHSDTVFSLEFSRDGKHLASASADRMAKVFRVETGELERTFEGHTHHVMDVSWQANGK
ncbi:MAG: hypothetical protein KDA60_09755, partial [Planctomycetales bacterium]|nr:hypothetical protein [Planctomycetales bacterium]